MTTESIQSSKGYKDEKLASPQQNLASQKENISEQKENISDSNEQQKKKKRVAPIKGGKPEKKQKPEKIVGDEAEQKILQYMKTQNRPYSVQNVFDNLHGTVGKTLVQRIMDQLTQNKQLLCKEYGKFKIYLYEQKKLSEDLVDDDASSKETQINDLKMEIALLESKVKDIKQIAQKAEERMQQLLSIETLEKEILIDEKYLQEHRKTESNRSITDPELIKSMSLKHRKLHDCWSRKKKLCQSIIHAMCPSLEMSMAAVIEELGLDTDESCIPADAYANY